MSKELTPLEALKRFKQPMMLADLDWSHRIEIIEKALTDYQYFNQLYMPSLSKSYSLEDMEKSLKALEIIKECFVLNGFDEFIPNSKWFENEEKQNLLKEVLK